MTFKMTCDIGLYMNNDGHDGCAIKSEENDHNDHDGFKTEDGH